MTSEKKKQSLVELAESLGFKRVPDDDPIYQEGWIITTTVSQELGRLNSPKKVKKRSGKDKNNG
jgi:hypothetical protein